MKKVVKKQKRNKKGFTLVEMIVVIAIIGVLAAMMVPSLLGYIDKANTSNNRAAATTIARSAQGVLAELNTTDVDGTFIGKSGGTKDATNPGGITWDETGDDHDAFQSAEQLMFDQGFVGKFEIEVTSGSLASVRYAKNLDQNFSGTTESTKYEGYYPE